MILTPYILKSDEPLKMRYMKLKEAPLGESLKMREHILTVDILQQESALHILLSQPEWGPKGLGNHIEDICSTLLILMDLNGLVKDKDKVFWYELSLFSFPIIKFYSVRFTNDGLLLSKPEHQSLHLEKSPFNLSTLRQE